MEVLVDPIFYRGVVRILVPIFAIIVVYLGYCLYVLGYTRESAKVDVSSAFMKFVVTGVGPGSVFMVFGCFILIASIVTGAASSRTERRTLGSSACDQPGGINPITDTVLETLEQREMSQDNIEEIFVGEDGKSESYE